MEDYVTYGDEWEKAVMKLTKREIVEMLRNAGRELEALKLSNSNDNNEGRIAPKETRNGN